MIQAPAADPETQLWRAVSNRQLQLILLPTEACNFRCVYCYETFAQGKMPREVVVAVKRYLTRRFQELQSLQLSWFGGEPLLALDVIEEICTHIAELRLSHPQCDFSSDMTTNASLLTPSIFERLCALGVNTYQISFDGARDEHDKRRIQANGGPTFDRIWGHLLAMRQSKRGFKAIVRLHLDAENVRSVERFIADFRHEFSSDSRFTLFIRPVSKLGGPNDTWLPVLDHDKALEIAHQLSLDCEKIGVPSRTMAKASKAPICYASQLNSWVVRSDGRLGKCTVALDSPANDVGHLLPDGSFAIDAERIKPWIRGLGSRNAKELGCPMQNFPSLVKPAAGPVQATRA